MGFGQLNRYAGHGAVASMAKLCDSVGDLHYTHIGETQTLGHVHSLSLMLRLASHHLAIF